MRKPTISEDEPLASQAIRINRFLAAAGLGSRRGCEELIRSGQVTINGNLCSDLATKVAPGDYVKANGRLIKTEKAMSVLFYKPRGLICTRTDEHDRGTIFDVLPRQWPRLSHVGRLDKESEGLLILTNDGALSLRLTHPRYKVEKEYEVLLDKAFDNALLPKLLKGMSTESGWAKAEKAHVVSPKRLKLTLRQGLKRQIRLMFYALGYEVEGLRRIRIGTLRLEGLKPGEWRFLSDKELDTLKKVGEPLARRAPPAATV